MRLATFDTDFDALPGIDRWDFWRPDLTQRAGSDLGFAPRQTRWVH